MLFGQIAVRGVVQDQTGAPLPYVSIYELDSSNATLTNEEGIYEITVSAQTQLVYQYLGYKTIQKDISPEDKNQTINLVMIQETYELGEIEISANLEDPAYSIIRKAIKNKSKYHKLNQLYEADLYVKGVIKIIDAPTKFMGQEIGNMEGIIDSNKQGIFYLSETQSTIKKSGDKTKEILHSSIVAGNDNGIGFNQFIKSNIDFYGENISIMRDMIGPLDDNATAYYTFRLEATQVDLNGMLIYRISVKPKSTNRPCFEGEIYIIDETFRIHSLELKTTGKAVKSPNFGDITIKQVHAPINSDNWKMITQTIKFDVGFFMFKAEGNFSSVFSNYNVDPQFPEGTFGAITFESEIDAIENDTSFWNDKRPITLTVEEKQDYLKKEKLQKIWESKTYLDSVDRQNNIFKLQNLLTGYSYNQSYKDQYFDIASPLATTNFNAVEGLNISIKPSYEHNDPNANKKFIIKADLGYGFVDKGFKPFISSTYTYDKMRLSSLYLNIGRQITDFSDLPIMAEISNSWHSLIFKNNFVKWYQNDNMNLGWSSEVINSLVVDASINYEDRTSLTNNTNYSIREKETVYLPNNPFYISPQNFNLRSKKLSIVTKLKWRPGQKIMKYPNSIIRLQSKWPTINLKTEYALPIGDNYTNFLKVQLGIEDNYLKTGKAGHLSYNLLAGLFIKEGGAFPDYFHFIGHEVIPRYISKYQSTYKLLPYYRLDSQDPFISAFLQHHLDGFVMDKIPLFKNLGCKFVISAAALIRDDIKYIEPGVGIEDIKLGPFSLFRIDYYWGFDQNGYRNKGFKFGFVNIFTDGISL